MKHGQTMFILLLTISIVVGALAMPIGMMPSIFLFRDLANGTDSSEATKRAYAFVLWGGIALAWLIGSYIAYAIINAIF